MPRRVLEGDVVSAVNDKTITVLVERRYRHPVYKKYIKRTDKFAAHDPANSCKVGDRVSIIECAPISKKKRWIVTTADGVEQPKTEKPAAKKAAPKKEEAKKPAAKKAAPKAPKAPKKETAKKETIKAPAAPKSKDEGGKKAAPKKAKAAPKKPAAKKSEKKDK